MRSKTLAAAISLTLLSMPLFAQSSPPKETALLTNTDKAREIPKETRAKIHETLSGENLPRAPKMDFPVELGAKIPKDVQRHQLPVDVLEMAPQLRGYDYVLVRNDVIFLNPGTLEIVAILTG